MTPNAHTREPDFLIIGAQKSGTTSLSRWLRSLDACSLPSAKELHFFSNHKRYNNGAGYSSYLAEFADAPRDKLTGEATPAYLDTRHVAVRVARHLPNVRLVMSLRNPIDRAFSAYLHAQRVGAVSKRATFEEALERESRECGAPWTDFLSVGCYARHIERYLQYFPREQMHIMLFEDLVQQESVELRSLWRFLAQGRDLVESPVEMSLPHVNRAALSRAPRVSTQLVRRYPPSHPAYKVTRRLLFRSDNLPTLRADTRARLSELYRPWNEALETLLDRPLEAWAS